tara:strand:- start:140 stop:331 length:192 start_codon:yes stop_codon:yes gene_type:complete
MLIPFVLEKMCVGFFSGVANLYLATIQARHSPILVNASFIVFHINISNKCVLMENLVCLDVVV